jgi:glyceraldehyde 3-phosphate dehydrogenase
MTINVGINGLGDMGRYLIRAIDEEVKDGKLSEDDIEVVAFNDLYPARELAPLVNFHSVYGYFDGEVKAEGKDIIINGKRIDGSTERDPKKLDWEKREVDIVYDATGVFSKRPGIEGHLDSGAKKVIISAPSQYAEKTLVMGVNDNEYDKDKHNIISNASCTTNCLAPLVHALYKEFDVLPKMMITTHAYTGDQKLIDAPHSSVTRSYAAAENIIPTTTGATKATGEIIKELEGEMIGLALRVPVPSGSITVLPVTFEEEITKDKLDKGLKNTANTYLKGILEYREDPLVSTKILGNPHSSIYDSLSSQAGGDSALILSWYDNVSGYTHRVIDVIKLIGK